MINAERIKENSKYLILVTGLPASGKTTIAKRLANEFGLHYIGKDEYKIKMYEDPLYYIDEAIKSEQFAIASYEEVLQDTTNIPYELNAIMLQNYYDELEHLDDLMVMKYAIEAGAELVQY